MGQAKRRKLAVAAGPCICGSGKTAGECCFENGRWNRAPAQIDLLSTGHVGRMDGCYLADLGTCCSKLSREHLVSDAVLEVIQKDQLVVSGLPWLASGEERTIGKSNLVAKCLCKAHNSTLSPLDRAAGSFFAAIEECALKASGASGHRLFCGHDIERWMLKTLMALAISGNLASDGERLAPLFHSAIRAPEMLQNPKSWPDGAGMYFVQRIGEEFRRGDHFWLAPLVKAESDEIVGMQTSVQGLAFVFLAVPPPPERIRGSPLEGAIYRPGRLVFRLEAVNNLVELSWNDGQGHGDIEMALTSMLRERAARRRRVLS